MELPITITDSKSAETIYWERLREELSNSSLDDDGPGPGQAIETTRMMEIHTHAEAELMSAGDAAVWDTLRKKPKSYLWSLSSKVRLKIWRLIPPNEVPKLRLLSWDIREEIDTQFGTQFIYDESLPRAIEWAKKVAISKLIVRKMVTPVLMVTGDFFRHPELLQFLEIDGPITSYNFHQLLRTCPKIRELSMRMSFFKVQKETREMFPDPSSAVLTMVRARSRSSPPFQALESLKIISILSENRDNFISRTVEPILQQVTAASSTKFSRLKLWIKCDLQNFKCLTDLVLKFIAGDPGKRSSTLSHLSLSFPGTKYDNYSPSPTRSPSESGHEFAETGKDETETQFPMDLTSLELLDLSRLSEPASLPWKTLISRQTNLRVFKSCIGTIHWRFYGPVIEQCSSTLCEVSLRLITTCSLTSKKCAPFDMGVFKNCTRLTSLELVGVLQVLDYTGVVSYVPSESRRASASTRLDNIHKLPQSLQTLTLENFKLNPTEVFQLHVTCPSLVNLSLQYWNYCRDDVETSLNLLEFMLTSRNYERCLLMDWKEYAHTHTNQDCSIARSPRSLADIVLSPRGHRGTRGSPKLRQPDNNLSSFTDLVTKLKQGMSVTVVADNSFAYGIELVAKPAPPSLLVSEI